MRILHYSLGFPPYRTGGLTKFCMDLMSQQIAEGHSVGLLWPGSMPGGRTRIKVRRAVREIASYEIINPLPVPYDEGITRIDSFMQEGRKDVYLAFLREMHPEVLHVHTLMGLHAALLDAAKQLGVRIVFTTHDFFPVCPKVTLYRCGHICDSMLKCADCPECNETALRLSRIRMLQSAVYRSLKDTPLVKKLRKRHRNAYFSEGADKKNDSGKPAAPACPPATGDSGRDAADYLRLRSHYEAMLQRMDFIHYNSSVTQAVYERVFSLGASTTIPITHADIADHRQKRTYSRDTLRIRFLGSQRGGKGYYLLLEALNQLWQNHRSVRLDVHFAPSNAPVFVQPHDPYTHADLPQIFDDTDVLVAPSVWYETFGYTVLEALSFGVPVIVSGTVGAKDVLAPGAGIVVEDISSKRLADVLLGLTPSALDRMNKCILEEQRIMTLPVMSERIAHECYKRG